MSNTSHKPSVQTTDEKLPPINESNTDKKRFMIIMDGKPSILAEKFDDGKILPFPILYRESKVENLSASDRVGKEIIQFSFLITNYKNEVFLYERAKYDKDKNKYGHTMSCDKSILVSWSPTQNKCPADMEDVFAAFREEIEAPHEPDFQFLGLIRNDIVKEEKIVCYYFYLFEARFNQEVLAEEFVFKKEKNDQPLRFVKIDAELVDSVSKMKADLQALLLFQHDQPTVTISEALLGKSRHVRDEKTIPFFNITPGFVISHTYHDHAHTKWLAQYFKSRNIPYWIDDEHMPHNIEWYKSVEIALKYGKGVIFVCTPHIANSKPVKDEIEMADKIRDKWKDFFALKLVFEKFHDNPFGESKFAEYPNCPLDELSIEARENELDALFHRYGFL